MVDSSKVLNPYERNVFLKMSNAFKTAEMKKIVLDYTINKAVYSLQIVHNLLKQNKTYRDIPDINKAFAWSYKSLKEFINEYPTINKAIRHKQSDAIMNTKLIADIKCIENILLQLPKQCNPESISKYKSNQLDQMLEDLEEKYKKNEDRFNELQQAQNDVSAANFVHHISTAQSSRISQDIMTQQLNDSIIERVQQRLSREILANTADIAKTRLNWREVNLKKKVQDIEEFMRIDEIIHGYKMDFNNHGIENYARQLERYTTEFEQKAEKLNNQINVTKFRVREYRRLNQSLCYQIQLYENAIKQIQEQESELQKFTESEKASRESLGGELDVEEEVK